MKIGNYTVEARFHARQPWTHFKIHRYNDYGNRVWRNGNVLWRHLVWGKLSLEWGQSHLSLIRVCSHCNEEIQMVSAGDECWDWCESCQQVEGDTEEITLEEFERRNP